MHFCDDSHSVNQSTKCSCIIQYCVQSVLSRKPAVSLSSWFISYVVILLSLLQCLFRLSLSHSIFKHYYLLSTIKLCYFCNRRPARLWSGESRALRIPRDGFLTENMTLLEPNHKGGPQWHLVLLRPKPLIQLIQLKLGLDICLFCNTERWQSIFRSRGFDLLCE